MLLRYTNAIILIIFFAGSLYSHAQFSVLRFQHYTTDDGLSQNMIDCILRDHKGFMWFGTWNGLNRFDGYKFVVYKQNPQNKNSLSNNFVRSLCQDINHNIWIATRNGLNIYRYDKNVFENIFNNSLDSLTPSSNDLSVVFAASDGTLWLGNTFNGLDRIYIDKNSKISRIERYKYGTGFQDLSSNAITCIYEDSKRNIWVGTKNGLNRFNERNRVFVKLFSNPQQSNALTSSAIQCVFEDRFGDLWIGTEFGLNRIDHNSNQIENYYFTPDNNNSLVHNVVRSIVEDLQGNLIIGTLGGISIYNRVNNNFTNHKFRLHDKYGLNNDFINCILTDTEGNVWIGTEKGGINKYNVYQHQFEFFVNELGKSNTLSHNTINSIFEDDKYLWIGTAGGGLNIFQKKTKRFFHFQFNPHNASSLSSDFVSVIYRDKNNNTWIGTWGSGINFIEAGKELSGTFIRYTTENGLISSFVSSIVEDKSGNIYIGTLGGLSIYNIHNKTFVNFQGVGEEPINSIGCLHFDMQGNLWVGTENGLFQILPARNGNIDAMHSSYNLFRHIPDDIHSISGDYIISIKSDKDGNLWIGTYGNGLNRLIPSASAKSIKFEHFDERDGFASSVIYGILEDDEANLWLSTDNGLIKFNYKKRIVKNYFESDGLLNNQFYWSAYFKNNEGKMYFGGMNGLTAFYPNQIKDDPNLPKMAFTDFKIYNQSVIVGAKYFGKIVLQKNIVQSQKIILSYKANEFSIEFSSLHYHQPNKNIYQYKLEGFDNNWIQVDHQRRFATYTNLKGGNYTFYVRGTNNDGLWAKEPLKVDIIIIPPFYATLWFKIFLVVLLVSFIVLYNRIRLYKLKKHNEKLESMVEQRTALIEKQKEELIYQSSLLAESNKQLLQRQHLIEGQKAQLELQNAEILEQRNRLMELNKKVQLSQRQQLKLFTHISHEFRTPLTLILAPIEQLLLDNISNSFRNKLLIIQKNAERLVHLVDQIMELRKIESGKTELNLIESDIVRFVYDISRSFEEIASQKHIHLQYYFNPDSIFTLFDKDKLENIIYNLLSNAIKYTPENKQVLVKVGLVSTASALKDEHLVIVYPDKSHQISEYIEIIVADEGIGISHEQIKDIFKQFYRIQNPFTQRVKGTGIGLYLTREMVKALHGYLYVNSDLNKGTSFRVLLPGGQYFKEMGYTYQTAEKVITSIKKAKYAIYSLDSEIEINVGDTEQSRNKHTVLIIDDDSQLLNFMANYFSKRYHVITAKNGIEGLRIATLHIPDLIVTDVMMPEMDGVELCQQLKRNDNTSHIPIILLSAKTEVEDIVMGLETGADDYVSKPFHLSILAAKLKSFLDNRQKLKEMFTQNLYPSVKGITSNKADERFLDKAIQIVNEHISDGNFTVEEFASKMCISRSLLHKKLTSIIGLSANDFILSLRMKKAMILIRENEQTISEIAYQVGFNDPKYFSKCFKKYYGILPSELTKG